jgi:hypothetical protein
MATALHSSREVSVDDVQRALSGALGPDYRVTVTSRSSVRVHNGVLTASTRVTRSRAGTDLRVTGFGITHRVRHALERAFPDQAELHRAYRWG